MVKIRELKEKKQTESDYAATADAFADKADTDSENPDDDSDESESESGEEEGQDNGEGIGEEDADDDEGLSTVPPTIEQPASATGEPCTFDLRNLLALNAHQVDAKALYKGKPKAAPAVTIPASQNLVGINVNEELLLEAATDGCSQLIAALWQLPIERSSAGPMVQLPTFDESRLPRSLPPPEAKKETKWEKFARERGLPLNKEKRSQKVFDEESGTWMFRHGYQKANNESKEWPIMEVKGGADPFADPWEKKRDEKRTRVEKNVEQRMRNEERAGNLEKGTTNKVLKSRERSRKAGKEGGNADRDQPLPAGLPVDIKNRKSDDATTHSQRGKISTLAALKATQRSTASLGKFDKMREGEPEKKKILLKAKKRKLESSTDRKVLSGEAEKSLKVLKSVVDGGGVAKERDIRRGKYAQGETAYDYQFDDGLGPSTFKKKKGRAGAGKSKKMTKKRIK